VPDSGHALSCYGRRMNNAAFPDMHDWTLSGVYLDWADAVAKFQFSSVGGGQRTLTLSKVIDLHVPKHQPWGPSVSVNRADWLTGMGDAIQTLRIEMQSGDVITVDASAFYLE
jgi:hypothetical protein